MKRVGSSCRRVREEERVVESRVVARRCGSHGREEGLIRGEACRGTELHVGEGARERGARIKGMHGGRGARVKGMGYG